MATEQRLIDANALLASKWWDSLKDDFDKARAKIIVQSCPTVDAVPVVRCNDCKYSNHCTIELELAKYWMPLSEHFCSYGERRTDE